MFPNTYEGRCQCRKMIPARQGYCQKVNGRWMVYCQECCPERIQPVQQQRREMVFRDGEVRVYAPYEAANLPLYKSFPGAVFDKSVARDWHWKVSASQADRVRVLEIADQLGLKVDPVLREVTVTEVAETAAVAGAFNFQVTGINWLSKQTNALLGDEMGLGKSMQSLVSLPKNARVMVIGPAGLKYNWRDEVERWRKDYKAIVINGSKNMRVPRKGEILIANFDILPDWLIEPAQPVKKPITPADYQANTNALNDFYSNMRSKHPELAECHIIIDEAHKVKGLDTQRGMKIRTLCNICSHVWGLTGTPLLNRPMDLWGILTNLNLAKKAFGNVSGEYAWVNFKRAFNATNQEIWAGKGKGYRKVLTWGDPSPEVPEKLRRVMLQRKRKDVLPDLPTKIYTDVLISLDELAADSHIKKELDSLWDEWGTLLDVKEDLPPFTSFSGTLEKLARACIPAMLEYIENCEEQDVSLVVASAHLGPLDAILGRDGWGVISGATKPEDRQRIAAAQRAGKLRGVGCSIAAAGVGLTLTGAARMLFVDLDWVPANNWQMEDRICVLKGQMVHTRRGFLPIEEVVVGDEVFTHLGNWRRVLNTHNREHQNLVTEILYTRYASFPLQTTHDHNIFVLKKGKDSPEWVKASEILPGDFLVFPRDKTEQNIEFIDYPMSKRLPQTPKGSGRRKLMPEKILVSSEFLEMVGWYLAEGFCSIRPGKGRFVSFSAHREERWFLEKIAAYLKKEFDIKSGIYTAANNGLEMRAFSADLAYFMLDLVGSGSRDKVIPPILMNLPKDRLIGLLSAYIGGDGYSRKRQHEWTSACPTLASQIAILLAKVGHAPCLRKNADTWIGIITVDGQPDNPSLQMVDDNYVYNPVRVVTTKFANRGTRVYDLQVEGDESFVVGLAAVHNCRIGATTNKCEIIRFVIDHPLCRHIHKLLAKKIALIAAAIDGKCEAKIPTVEVTKGETEAEFLLRMERLRQVEAEIKTKKDEEEKKYAKAKARSKALVVLEREQCKANGTTRKVLPLTPERIAAIRRGFQFMLSVCDGALAKDSQGFNKPDASVAHCILPCGLEAQDELEAAYWMLTRYHRQLAEREPLLFKN